MDKKSHTPKGRQRNKKTSKGKGRAPGKPRNARPSRG